MKSFRLFDTKFTKFLVYRDPQNDLDLYTAYRPESKLYGLFNQDCYFIDELFEIIFYSSNNKIINYIATENNYIVNKKEIILISKNLNDIKIKLENLKFLE
ncbi:MAG: hypothetical protein LC122_02405 [Chitinophagales bacterium]|nr:hypothetical protein [Chitinophagales bacterium]